MPKARTRARKDGNHNELVKLWCDIGGTWLDLYQLPGCLDGLAGMYGIDGLVEIKDPTAERGRTQAMQLTDAEQKLFDTWGGRKPRLWSCADDVHATKREHLAASLGRAYESHGH